MPATPASSVSSWPPATAAPGPGTALDLAIVIPAYNERDGVGATVDRVRDALKASAITWEVVVVDDGSGDGTGSEAEAHGARVITQVENQGYGAALKAGIAGSDAALIAIIDADGTYPPEAIPRLVELAANADMVVGARAMQDRSIPVERRPGKWLLVKLASYLSEREIPDLNSGLRVMRRTIVERFLHILPSGFSFTTTITLALLSTGHRVAYEPIACEPRIGASKLRATDFMGFVMLVLRTIVLFNPLRVFLPLGTLLFVAGLGKFVYDVALWNLSESAVMAFLAAIIVWSVGLLADMIARLQLRPPGSF